MEAGFDPREVIDKSKLGSHFVATVIEELREAFPLKLNLCQGGMEPWNLPPPPSRSRARRRRLGFGSLANGNLL